MEDPDRMTALFRQHGLKVTPQRQCIFEILYANPTHSTAEAIYGVARRRMPTISLKTVYETLHSLAGLGQVQELDLGIRSTLFDPDVHHHHHLVCSSCGRIDNVELDLGPLARSAAERHGFVLGHTDMILRGLCPDCVSGDQ
ncbi:MAG: transcriptional repressor [Acidimicrobiaceae bacterium]|nr:transcriptional repressor [Acidimicrobiaceae bacterium]